jgi:predicted Na+-dependent transporter
MLTTADPLNAALVLQEIQARGFLSAIGHAIGVVVVIILLIGVLIGFFIGRFTRRR